MLISKLKDSQCNRVCPLPPTYYTSKQYRNYDKALSTFITSAHTNSSATRENNYAD